LGTGIFNDRAGSQSRINGGARSASIRRHALSDDAAAIRAKITVAFTQQQWLLIDRLKAEGRWGTSREEIIRNVLRDYVKQELGE
jgi:hypothetical protein